MTLGGALLGADYFGGTPDAGTPGPPRATFAGRAKLTASARLVEIGAPEPVSPGAVSFEGSAQVTAQAHLLRPSATAQGRAEMVAVPRRLIAPPAMSGASTGAVVQHPTFFTTV